MSTTQYEKARRFRELHAGPGILVLPNAWDAAGARIYEDAGFPAIGTTSAGVAFSLGYADGQNAPRDEVLFVAKRIVQTVGIPVTVDVEAGYGAHSVDAVLETVRGVLQVGAVGINLEDAAFGAAGLVDIGLQADKIRAIRALGEDIGIPLVINARTDAFRLNGLTADARLRLAIERANAYSEAGADCLFVPFVAAGAAIAELARAIHGPLNILATPGTPPVSELEQMGVRRVSVGSGPHRAILALVRQISLELRSRGTYNYFTDNAISYAELNALFSRSLPPAQA